MRVHPPPTATWSSLLYQQSFQLAFRGSDSQHQSTAAGNRDHGSQPQCQTRAGKACKQRGEGGRLAERQPGVSDRQRDTSACLAAHWSAARTLRIVTHFDTSSGSPGGPGSWVTGGRLPAWVRPLLWLPGARAEWQSTKLPARSWGHSLGQATQPRAALPHSSKHRRLSWFPGLLQTASPSRTHRGQPQSLHLHHPGIKLKPFAPPRPDVSCKGCGSAELAVPLEQQGK